MSVYKPPTEIRNQYRRNNYQKTALYSPRHWTQHEMDLVVAHNIPDSELSAKISRSVMSIQLMRCRLKKKEDCFLWPLANRF